MQLWQLTTAVVAGSDPPRQWLLLPIPGKDVFGLGMIVGAMAVALARVWLWWRNPKRSQRSGARGVRASERVPLAASAPVSVAVSLPPVELPSRPAAAASLPAAPASRPVAPPSRPVAPAIPPGRARLTPPPPSLPGEPAAPPSGPTDADILVAVRELLTGLARLKVTLATGRPPLVDRYLTAAVAELASGESPCGRCDLVLVGFPAPATAAGLTMRRDSMSAALDVIAARTVAARRRLGEPRPGGAGGGNADPRTWPLTVLVSRTVPTSAELAMLVDLVNEPGRVAALLPARKADQLGELPAAAAVVELTSADDHPGDDHPAESHPADDQAAGLTSTLRSGPVAAADGAGAVPGEVSGRGTPDLAQATQPRPASLRIGVLGQLTINGQPGALLPAQTQLIVALALNGEAGLLGRQLCELLGSDADHPKPADSLRQLIARTRRQLGQTGDGSEWIEHLGHGRYALHKETRLDWHEFERLTDQGIRAGDASQLTAALAMIRGQPFTGCFYWWLDIELIDAVSAKIVTAATTLAELALGRREAGAAARAARIGLVADVTSEPLWRQLMRAEHAAGNLAGVRDAWSRCVDAVAEIAIDGEPEPGTAALYHQLVDR